MPLRIVSAVITSGLEPPVYGPRPAKATKLKPFEAYLRERLGAVPELTARRLHREIAALGYSDGYTAVGDLLREVSRRPTLTGSHGAVEGSVHVGPPRRISRHGLGAAADCQDGGDDLIQPSGGAAGDEDVMALGREAPGQCGTEALLGADPDDDGNTGHPSSPFLNQAPAATALVTTTPYTTRARARATKT